MKVTLHRLGSMGLMGAVQLRHGENEVAADAWAKVAGHPVVKELLRKGRDGGVTIETSSGVPIAAKPVPKKPAERTPEPPKPEPAPVSSDGEPESGDETSQSMKAKDVVALVRQMSLMELEALEEDEERKTVLDAIQKRRDELLGEG